MEIKEKKIGPLLCRILDGPKADSECRCLVLLSHGFGATGSDLVGIGSELFHIGSSAFEHVSFVFPEAPINMASEFGFEARAWWRINMQALTESVSRGDFQSISKAIPDGMHEATEMLAVTVNELLDSKINDDSRMIVGGFSQGAMLSTNFCLSRPASPAHLILYSGMLINEDQWRQSLSDRSPLNVYQSHGQLDSIIPFANATSLRDLFESTGHNLNFHDFQGDHTIPMDGIEYLAKTILDVVSQP